MVEKKKNQQIVFCTGANTLTLFPSVICFCKQLPLSFEQQYRYDDRSFFHFEKSGDSGSPPTKDLHSHHFLFWASHVLIVYKSINTRGAITDLLSK